MGNQKIIIYQIFTRLFGNRTNVCKQNGTIAENGCGKMNFFTDEVLHMYLARGLKPGECHPDEDEFLERDRVPLGELVKEVMDGTIQDAKTVAAVLKAKVLLDL